MYSAAVILIAIAYLLVFYCDGNKKIGEDVNYGRNGSYY